MQRERVIFIIITRNSIHGKLYNLLSGYFSFGWTSGACVKKVLDNLMRWIDLKTLRMSELVICMYNQPMIHNISKVHNNSPVEQPISVILD